MIDGFHSDDDVHQLGIVVVNVLDQFGLCIGWSRNENRTGVCNCAGFRSPGLRDYPHAPAAGDRKAPRHGVAGSGALAGSEPYGDFDISADLVCGREADTPSASVGMGREAATRIAERFHNFRVSA